MESTAMKVNGQESLDIAQLHYMERSADNNWPKDEIKPAEETRVNDLSELTGKDVRQILDSFQDLSETIQTKLNFTIHEENNAIIVKVIDKETNQLIRQFPSDEMLDLQDKMRDLAGFLFNENV